MTGRACPPLHAQRACVANIQHVALVGSEDHDIWPPFLQRDGDTSEGVDTVAFTWCSASFMKRGPCSDQ